jgi:Holliday junction resolvase RusA-like endonuclease
VSTTDFFVPGKPVPKARARFALNFAYTPRQTSQWESVIAKAARIAYRAKEPHSGPCRVEIEIRLSRPPSTKRIFPSVRPDFDNYAKSVCDAINGIVYRDDGQIVSCSIEKVYCEPAHEPGIRVRVTELCSLAENEGKRTRIGIICG